MTNPQSLFDAIIQQLRGNSAVTTAFGDTWVITDTIPVNITDGNVCKFWSDYAGMIGNVLVGDPVEPYVVLEEIGESYDFMTPVSGGSPYIAFLAAGTAIARIKAPSRALARSLGLKLCAAMNDMDVPGVTWPGEGTIVSKLMMLRMRQASFAPSPAVGPSTASVFSRVIAFDYEYQGFL